MIEVTASIDIGDVNKVADALRKGADAYGGDMVKTTKKMTAKIVRSLVASTVQAPKRRKVTRLNKVQTTRRDNLAFRVDGLRGKTGHKVPSSWIVAAKSKENAIRRHGIIAMRGLAKKSWQMAGKSLGGVEVISVDINDAKVARSAARFGKGVGKFNRYEVYVRLTNELAYIQQAMKGSGDQAASTVVDRAVNSFLKDAERVAAKRLSE